MAARRKTTAHRPQCPLPTCDDPAIVVVNHGSKGLVSPCASLDVRACARHEGQMWEYLRTEHGVDPRTSPAVWVCETIRHGAFYRVTYSTGATLEKGVRAAFRVSPYNFSAARRFVDQAVQDLASQGRAQHGWADYRI